MWYLSARKVQKTLQAREIPLPAMAISHLLFFGPVEAIGTALVVSYVLKTNEALIYKPLIL